MLKNDENHVISQTYGICTPTIPVCGVRKLSSQQRPEHIHIRGTDSTRRIYLPHGLISTPISMTTTNRVIIGTDCSPFSLQAGATCRKIYGMSV